jgi:hypothetical protein
MVSAELNVTGFLTGQMRSRTWTTDMAAMTYKEALIHSPQGSGKSAGSPRVNSASHEVAWVARQNGQVMSLPSKPPRASKYMRRPANKPPSWNQIEMSSRVVNASASMSATFISCPTRLGASVSEKRRRPS